MFPARHLVVIGALLVALLSGAVEASSASAAPQSLLSAAAAAGPAAAAPNLCYGGVTYGQWDLPASPNDGGFARGILVAGGPILYHLSAKLTEIPSPALSLRFGEIWGFLGSPYNPNDLPQYGIKGRWSGSALSGDGTWQATIFRLDTGDPVGQMQGKYHDPGPYTHRVIGEFKGDWTICVRP
jgi:hypothetical protein